MRAIWVRARPRDWGDWLAVAGIVAIFAAASLVIYSLHFQDNPPLVVNNEPLPLVVEQETYKPGDRIIFNLDFCRRSDGAIRMTRRWIDGLMYIEPEEHLAGGRPECVVRNIVATVPNLPPGIYHVEYDVSYYVNLLAGERLVTFKTATFEVVADE